MISFIIISICSLFHAMSQAAWAAGQAQQAGGKTGMWVLTGLGILVVIIVLRRMSEIRPSIPQQNGCCETPTTEAESVEYDIDSRTASYRDIEYTVDMFDESTVSVEIDLGKDIEEPLEVDAKAGRPELPENDKKQILTALLDMGADYIEAGFNADIVGVQIPASKLPQEPPTGPGQPRKAVLDTAKAEKIVQALIQLRDLCH